MLDNRGIDHDTDFVVIIDGVARTITVQAGWVFFDDIVIEPGSTIEVRVLADGETLHEGTLGNDCAEVLGVDISRPDEDPEIAPAPDPEAAPADLPRPNLPATGSADVILRLLTALAMIGLGGLLAGRARLARQP